MQKKFFQIWGWPIGLGVFTAFGLLAALLGTGMWHWFAWSSLLIPLVMMAYYTLKNTGA